MKTKSKSGFILGLLGLLAGVPIGYYAFYVLLLVFGLSGAGLVYELSIWLFPIAGIIALIALIFMLIKAKIGGIFMCMAFICYIVPFILAFTVKGLNFAEVILPLLLGLLPAVLMLISAIRGLKAKPYAEINSEK